MRSVVSVVDSSEQATVSDDVGQQWRDTDAVDVDVDDGKVRSALMRDGWRGVDE